MSMQGISSTGTPEIPIDFRVRVEGLGKPDSSQQSSKFLKNCLRLGGIELEMDLRVERLEQRREQKRLKPSKEESTKVEYFR